jgi:hypothetical protein
MRNKYDWEKCIKKTALEFNAVWEKEEEYCCGTAYDLVQTMNVHVMLFRDLHGIAVISGFRNL